MEVEKIDSMAANDIPPPEDLTAEELLLYLQLSDLYTLFRRGQLDKKKGKKKKDAIVQQFKENMARLMEHELLAVFYNWIGKKVIYKKSKYKLTAIICRGKQYQAELLDKNKNSIVIARLKEIEIETK